jgi:hypothetical protein
MEVHSSWRRHLLGGLSMAAVLSAWGIADQPTSAPAGAGVAEPIAAAQRGGGAPQGPQPAGSVPELRFRYVGPPNAGRVAAAAGVPGDPTTYYLGAAAGGVWKSTDSGQTWAPIFDSMPVQAIGSLAVAASDHNQVWAGTGEAWVIRDSDIGGDGIYKSTDAGKTWKNMGLPEAGRIGRILVNPVNPNIVWACVIGRVTGPQQEKGVYKTTDGGASWTRSLFVDQNTGCSGISMDATNPDVLIAGMWQVEMHTWALYSGGPGSGVYITRDAGRTWEKAETGMPAPPVGKIDVAIAPSDSNRMYALIQTGSDGVLGMPSRAQGSLWRSDDAGSTWRVVSWDRTLIGRAGYYISMKVNPQNADDVFVLNSSFHRSTDGGVTFGGGGGGGGCGDCHDVWIDPTDGRRYVLTDDGGARITSPTGNMSVSLPIGQMYHVGTDDRMPYWVYSNRQDDGTMRGPNDSPIQVPNVPSYEAGAGAAAVAAAAVAVEAGAALVDAAMRLRRHRRRRAATRKSRRCSSRSRSCRRSSRPRAPAAPAAATRRRGTRGSAGASPASRCRCRRTPTSCGRRVTRTRSRATTRGCASRTPSARGFTRSTPNRRSSSTAATGRRRLRSIPSRTRPSTTAAT